MKFWSLLFLVPSFAFAQAPLLDVHASRAPILQGQGFAIFVSDPNPAAHPTYTLAATMDGAAVSLQPAAVGLWSVYEEAYGAVANHTLAITIFEGGTQIGSQSFNFSVQANPGNNSFPSVASVTPNVGGDQGGTQVLIQGANFANGATVKINGSLTASSFIDSGDILAITPGFGGVDGPKSVEVDLPVNNTQDAPSFILPNAFYASSAEPSPTPNPVAIVTNPNLAGPVGTAVTLNGSQSYDLNGFSISYDWKFLAVPAGSLIPNGSCLSAVASPSFTPDAPGVYVLRLVAHENSSFARSSPPELAVVQVSASRLLFPSWLGFAQVFSGGF